MGWYLVVSLVVSGMAGGSPWLHRLLEHGASDQTPAHVHWRGGRSGTGDDFFAAFQNAASAVIHGHAHSHASDHGHPEARQPASDPAAGHGSGAGSESSEHSHHGLPALLAAGLVDLAGPAAMVLWAVLGCVVLRPLLVLGWTEVFTLDWTQAARPPPRAMGTW